MSNFYAAWGFAKMYSVAEIRRLALVYSGAKGKRLSTVSKHACGNKQSLVRLESGKNMRSDTLERAGKWFEQNWPSNTPWPLSQSSPKKIAGGPSVSSATR
jgi:hypothetical protein